MLLYINMEGGHKFNKNNHRSIIIIIYNVSKRLHVGETFSLSSICFFVFWIIYHCHCFLFVCFCSCQVLNKYLYSIAYGILCEKMSNISLRFLFSIFILLLATLLHTCVWDEKAEKIVSFLRVCTRQHKNPKYFTPTEQFGWSQLIWLCELVGLE